MLKQYIINNNFDLKEINIINIEEDLTYEYIDDIMFVLNKYMYLGECNREYVYIITIDDKGKPNKIYLLNVGDSGHSNIDNQSLIKFLLLSNEKRFLVVHNHPNMILSASEDDLLFLNHIDNISLLLNIKCIGNYIITIDGYYNIKTNETFMLNYDEYK